MAKVRGRCKHQDLWVSLDMAKVRGRCTHQDLWVSLDTEVRGRCDHQDLWVSLDTATVRGRCTHQGLWVSLDVAEVGVHKVTTQELQEHLLALRVTELSLHSVGKHRSHVAFQLRKTCQ